MAYSKTAQGGSIQITKGTTGAGSDAKMPNFGTSVIANTTTEVFVLAPPVQGCRKRIVIIAASTATLPVIRASTATSDTSITFMGATTGLNIMTLTTARLASVPLVIDLEGYNSTSWLITGMCPDTTLYTAMAFSSGA